MVVEECKPQAAEPQERGSVQAQKLFHAPIDVHALSRVQPLRAQTIERSETNPSQTNSYYPSDFVEARDERV